MAGDRHVVIVGGGFAGLSAARALRRAPVRITLLDRRNHHVFQPLLYQVATAMLSPAQIAAPLRHVLARQRNVRVVLAEAIGVDLERRRVRLDSGGSLEYDALVLATGAAHSYFGRDEWAPRAPGLKTIEDALEIRRRFLLAFEAAERTPDPLARAAELTFAVVGGGPTGVELAGAMAEIARRAFRNDFRTIDPATATVLLLEAAPRVLPGFPPELGERARRDLESLGVTVRTGTRVEEIDERGVWVSSGPSREHLPARHVVWAAGVRASPIGATLGVELDGSGRILVGPDLSLPGRPEVFVAGDLARVRDKQGREVDLPGVAPAAVQMGRHVARLIAADAPAGARPPFRYRNKGILATIGRNRAVAAIGRTRLTGVLAWHFWALVHVVYLIGFRSRVLVMLEWIWAYVTFQRGARLITGPTADHPPPGPVQSTPPRRSEPTP